MTNSLVSNSESWIVQTWSNNAPVPSASQAPRETTNQGNSLQADFIVRTITQLLSCSDPSEAARLMVNRLQQFLGCRQVAIGLRQGRGRCRIDGLSGVVRFDSHSKFVRAVQDALDETLVRKAPTAWPPNNNSNQQGALAHQQLVALLGADCVASAPLYDKDQQIIGAVLFIDEPADGAFRLVQRFGSALATCLTLLERNKSGLVSRTAQRVKTSFITWKGRMAWLATACVAILMAVPVPYRVECPCEVQPVTRRFIAAPYDGTLEQSLVSPGSIVRKGDVLARMEEREIRWELDGLNADLSRARKERDSAMASHRTSETQLAELEMERLALQIQLLENRVNNLAIKSPIDGVVVAGDLEKAEGAPLTIGQTLFEVAPLDQMRIELDVPESEIARIAPNMPVTAHLDALPDETIAGFVERIHPQAELRDQSSVFVADLQIENPRGQLRPGMNGWAKVTSNSRRLAWVLFHKPWTSVKRMLAW